jgi:hypothetical protein
MVNRKQVLFILGAALFLSTTAFGQVGYFSVPAESFSAAAGVQFYSRTLKDEEGEEKVHQWVFPLFATGQWLRRDLHISLSQTLTSAQVEESPSLSGLENTKIRASYRVFENALAYVGASLPVTGVEDDPATTRVNNLLYTEALQFGVARITEGFDLDVGLGYALPLGGLSFGFGAGYILKGDYDRLSQGANLVNYDPGDVLSLSFTGQFRSGQTDLRGKVLYNRYSDDVFGDLRFTSGDELTLLAAGTFPLKPLELMLYVTDTLKGESAAEQAGVSVNNAFRNRLTAGMGLTYPMSNERLLLNAQTSLRRFFGDDGVVESTAASFGGGFQYFITDRLAVDVSTRFITGEINAGQTDVSGYTLSFLAHYGL